MANQDFTQNRMKKYTRARRDYEFSDEISCASIGASIQKDVILDEAANQ
jgi:hypothetical protein